MAKNRVKVESKFRYELVIDGEPISAFQEYDGPAFGSTRVGQRTVALKMGSVSGDASKILIEWYDEQVVKGHAGLRNFEVYDSSTMDKTSFERDMIAFFDATLISMNFYRPSTKTENVTVELVNFHFSHFKSIRS